MHVPTSVPLASLQFTGITIMSHVRVVDRSTLGPCTSNLPFKELLKEAKRILTLNHSNEVRPGVLLQHPHEHKFFSDGITLFDTASVNHDPKNNLIVVYACPGFKFHYSANKDRMPLIARFIEEKLTGVCFKWLPGGVEVSCTILSDCFSFMLQDNPITHFMLFRWYNERPLRAGAPERIMDFRFQPRDFPVQNHFNFRAHRPSLDQNIDPYIIFDRQARTPADIADFLCVILGLPVDLENPSMWLSRAQRRLNNNKFRRNEPLEVPYNPTGPWRVDQDLGRIYD